MKRAIALAVVAAALAGVAPAPAANPIDAKIAKLQKQVADLQKRVTTLEKQLKQATNIAAAGLTVSACLNAVTTDALQGTWNVIDQISTATQAGKTYFGAQTPISDAKSCSALRITRSQAVPPNVSVFSALAALLS